MFVLKARTSNSLLAKGLKGEALEREAEGMSNGGGWGWSEVEKE